jgi:uncharacterized protein YbcI
MDTLTTEMAQQIAEAASVFQCERTGHTPQSVTVVLGEDTLVITLCGALSPAEKALAQSPAGAARVQEFHRKLFASSSDTLRQAIQRITGLEVREAAAEIEPATGTVVHAFTTGTMVQVFQLAKGIPGDAVALTHVSLAAWNTTGSTPITGDTMSNRNSSVGIFGSHTEAEGAVKELQHGGFDIRRLSIVGRDYHTDENVVGYYNAGDRMKYWGQQGAFWGGLWGLLFGSAFFFVPGIGPLVVAGPLVSWIVGALEGAAVVGGLSALGAGLYSMGIPRDSILKYETALKSGKFVLIYHGTPEEVAKAKDLLDRAHASETHLHLEEPAAVI